MISRKRRETRLPRVWSGKLRQRDADLGTRAAKAISLVDTSPKAASFGRQPKQSSLKQVRNDCQPHKNKITSILGVLQDTECSDDANEEPPAPETKVTAAKPSTE